MTSIVGELCAAERRAQALLDLPSWRWTTQPARGRWSAAECVAHLNLTSEALVPVLRRALCEVASIPRRSARYRQDALGWLVWKALEPAGRLKTRTPRAFEPTATLPHRELVDEFSRWQAELHACLTAADGLALDRVKVVSPFNARVRYSLFSALTLVPRHQHRHLAQAERAAVTVAEVSPAAVWSGA